MSTQADNLTPLGLPRRWNGMCPSCWELWKAGESAPSDCDQCGPAWLPFASDDHRGAAQVQKDGPSDA